MEEDSIALKTPLTYYPLIEKAKKVAPPTFKYKLEDIAYSSKKLAACCKLISGLPLEEALMMSGVTKKKGGGIMSKAIHELKKVVQEEHGLLQAVSIKHAIVGKANRSKKLDLKAKGRYIL